MKKTLYLLLLPLISMLACSDDKNLPETGKPGQGYGSLILNYDVDPGVSLISGETRANTDLSAFFVVLEDGDGVRTVVDYPASGVIKELKAGTYKVTVTSHPDGFTVPGFEEPSYEGSREGVVVAEGASQTITITCYQSNAGVYFNYDDSLGELANTIAPVLTGDFGALVYREDNKGSKGYFAPGEVTLTALDNGTPIKIGDGYSKAITLEKRELLAITLKSEDGLKLEVNFDVEPIFREEDMSVHKGTESLETVLVPAGSFLMGAPESEPYALKDEKPQHEITLTRDFYMGKYPVTNAQYAAFLNAKNVTVETLKDPYWGRLTPVAKCTWGDNEGKMLAYSTEGWNLPSGNYDIGLHWDEESGKWAPSDDSGYDYSDHPVIHVTWYGACEFAKWMGGRLPTEAQWEYACRGGRDASLPFGIGDGTKLYSDMANIDGKSPYDLAFGGRMNMYTGENNAYLKCSTPVGSYPYANDIGLYDMHGNVYEWVWESLYYYNAHPGPLTDPVGPSEGSFRMIRGGQWMGSGEGARSAYRNRFDPKSASPGIGFRVVFSL